MVAAAGDHAINAVDLTVFRLTHRIELHPAPSGESWRLYRHPRWPSLLTATNGTLHLIDTTNLAQNQDLAALPMR